jgi:hypothetical protein
VLGLAGLGECGDGGGVTYLPAREQGGKGLTGPVQWGEE